MSFDSEEYELVMALNRLSRHFEWRKPCAICRYSKSVSLSFVIR